MRNRVEIDSVATSRLIGCIMIVLPYPLAIIFLTYIPAHVGIDGLVFRQNPNAYVIEHVQLSIGVNMVRAVYFSARVQVVEFRQSKPGQGSCNAVSF